MQIYATITGDKEVQKKLKLLMQKCEEKVIDMVKIATIKTEAEAKKAAPVLTGRLQSSITHELINKQKEHSGRVGTNVTYAPHQEFGTKRMKAHPFLYPALKIGMELLKSKIQNEIKKITV